MTIFEILNGKNYDIFFCNFSQRGPVMTRSRTRSLAPNVTEAERATTEGKILHPSHPGIHHPSLGLPP